MAAIQVFHKRAARPVMQAEGHGGAEGIQHRLCAKLAVAFGQAAYGGEGHHQPQALAPAEQQRVLQMGQARQRAKPSSARR